MSYTTPYGEYPLLCDSILSEPNVLIAGCAGSGKSVLLRDIIYAICVDYAPLYGSPKCANLWLADPKSVELSEWLGVPHVERYSDSYDGILSMMDDLIAEMDARYQYMAKHRQKKWTADKIYFIVDELADLMVTRRREFTDRFSRLMNKSRAAEIHVIACTQSPSRVTLPAQTVVNYSAVVGLRCRTAIESRQVIGMKGCETLPRYGTGYYLSADGLSLEHIDMIDDAEIDRVKQYCKAENKLKPQFMRYK